MCPRPLAFCFVLVVLAAAQALVSSPALPSDPAAAPDPPASAASQEQNFEFFEKQVRPILATRCYECHSGRVDKPKGGLRLDLREAALKGGDTGPAIVPGKPRESLLVDAIRYDGLYQMPPKSKLPAEEIAILTRWVELGAPWPQTDNAPEATSKGGAGQEKEFDLSRRRAEHWCWQPIRAASPPAVRLVDWCREPLDAFILARLEEAGLVPAPRADTATLVRRVYYDLVGLPPTPQEVAALVADPAPDAYERLVDRLLASPQFGERWGRHWLDLVRYAESRGHEFDYDIPNAFEYRDYVIRGLNADVPYDQWVLEHLAGDLLSPPRRHPVEGYNESILGTGFWLLGEWVHSPVDIRKDACDRIDNMLDVFSKTFLGLTVACARCHDHKFDAISQRDYYALAGYLHSASYRLTRLADWSHDRPLAARLAALERSTRPRLAAALAEALRARQEALATRLVEEIASGGQALQVLDCDLSGARVIVDYSRLTPGQWMTEGPTFGEGPVRAGQLRLPDEPDQPLAFADASAACRQPFWGDLGAAPQAQTDPGRLGSWLRAGRTLKTPTFTLESGQVHYLIEGAGQVYAAVDLHAMINGPLHGELVKETGGNSDLPRRWITHDLSRYVGHRVHLEFSPKEGEDFRLLMVVEGARRPSAPAPRPNRLLAPLEAAAASTRQALALQLIDQTLTQLADDRLADDSHPEDRAALANWMLATSGLDTQPPPAVAALLADYAQSRQQLQRQVQTVSRLALALWDGTPVDEFLLIRGNPKTPAAAVPRRNLEAFGGQAAASSGPAATADDVASAGSGGQVHASPTSLGSGRLELAHSLVDPANPLVRRVIVNRLWHHLFGRGIVPSVDNFGVLGQPPTHPELLDFLAEDFLRGGWSVKRLIRQIVLSSSYQMSSHPTGPAAELAQRRDPENRLFHRQNLRRLQGEALRDTLLALSGRLDLRQFGPSVPVHLTPFMQGRGRPKESGPLDGDGRRSIYLAVRRNFLSPMMLAFDTPIPFTTIGRRNVSNVPAQALILMNDPMVQTQAQLWARRIADEVGSDPAARIDRMYLAAFARLPTPAERQAALNFLVEQTRSYRELSATTANRPAHEVDPHEAAWADLAHALINVKQFLIVD